MKTKKIEIQNPDHPEGKTRIINLHDDHPMITRRDFMKAGLLPSAAKLFMPSALSWMLMQEKANAAICPQPLQDPNLPFFLQVSCDGGLPLEAFALSAKPLSPGSGTPLQRHMDHMLLDYGGQGRDVNAPQAYHTNYFNFPVWTQSKVTQNLLQFTSAANLQKCSMVAIPTGTFADSKPNNPLSCAAGIASLTSKLFVGSQNKPNFAPFSPASVSVNNSRSLSDLYQPGTLPKQLAQQLFNTAYTFNTSRENALNHLKNGLEFSQTFTCAAGDATRALALPSLDPYDSSADQTYAQAFQATAANSQRTILATLMNAMGAGLAGAASFVQAGCDCHGQGPPGQERLTEETRSEELACIIGGFVEACARKQRRGMLYIESDGSAYTQNSSAYWYSDSNHGSLLMIFFDPNHRPQVSQLQVGQTGWINSNSTADTNLSYRGVHVGAVAMAHFYKFWKPGDPSLNGLLPLLPVTAFNSSLPSLVVL